MKYKISAIICTVGIILATVSPIIAVGNVDSSDSASGEVTTVSVHDPLPTLSDNDTRDSVSSDTSETDGDPEESSTAIHGVTTDGESDPEESSTAIHGTTTDGENDPEESSTAIHGVTTDGGSTDTDGSSVIAEPEPVESVQSIIYKYLTGELGLCSAAAAGIMGNVMIECGFDPTLEVIDTNDKPSFGLMMWNGPRYEALKKWCEEHGYEKTDPKGQLGYLKWELENTEKASYASMKNIPDTGRRMQRWNFCIRLMN